MQNSGKLFLKVFTALILSIILYSCDFFAPYDLEFVSVSQEKLEFGMFEIEKQFVITNVDSFDVNWEILPAINWITISPMSGKINAADPDTVTVKINRSKLIPGKYSDKIEISFENKTNSKFIELLMEIKAQLRVSQDSMRFGIYDSLKSFKLFNSGNYPLKWSFIADEEWISVQPDTGTLLVDSTKFLSNGTQSNSTSKYSDATVFVKIDNKKISAGDHIGLLHLKTENGIDDTIKVFATKSPDPLIKLSESQINFGTDENLKYVTIDNIGGSELNWTAQANASWITVSPRSGNSIINSKASNNITTVNTSQIEISVDRNGLIPGVFTSSVDITSNGGNASIEVTMIVPEAPELEISEAEINFGNLEIIKRIQVSNSGTGKLVWSVSNSESWITVFPINDSTYSENKEITVSANRVGLMPGSYSGKIEINSNGGNKLITVNMSVDELPKIDISSISLSFDINKTTLSFNIRNSGGGELDWNLSSNDNWILFVPSSGKTSTETDQVNVTVNRIGLSPGNYSGSIKIESIYESRMIDVSMTVEQPPLLSYSPQIFNFGEIESTGLIEIINTGGGILNWQLSANQPWITLTQQNGSVSSNQKNEISVEINRSGLQPGNYSGNIIISSNGGNGTIPVSITVLENPIISLSKHTLDFNTGLTSLSFNISNSGTGVLNWNIESNLDPWISVSSSSGSVTTDETEITIIINRALLSPGQHVSKIDITSNGGTESVDIKVESLAGAILSVDQTSIDFGNTATIGTLKIENTGTGTLYWSSEIIYIAGDSDWLQIQPAAGSTDNSVTLTLAANRNGLSGGQHTADIQIYSNGGVQTIHIYLFTGFKF